MIKALFKLIVLLILSNSVFAQKNLGIKEFYLPSGYNSGLTKFWFSSNIEFKIETIGSKKELSVRLNLIPSRAGNIQGRYDYRYTYYGKQYTDHQLGMDVFQPIDFTANMRISVVGRPGLNIRREVVVNWEIYTSLGYVPDDVRTTDFLCVIRDVESVTFYGTDAIEKKIKDLIAATENTNKAESNTSSSKKETSPGSSGSGNTQTKTSDEWGAVKKTTTGTNTTNTGSTQNKQKGTVDLKDMPTVFQTSDGRYFRKEGGGLKEISQNEAQQYVNSHPNEYAGSVSNNQGTKSNSQDEYNKAMATLKQQQDNYDNYVKGMERIGQLSTNAMVAANADQEARKTLAETTTLSGNYQSVDQLMAEFNQKMSAINSQVTDLTEKKNAAWNAKTDYIFNGNDATEQSVGMGIKLLGNIVNNAQQEKEKKAAQQHLKAQKDQMLRELQEQEKQMISGIRGDLFRKFPEGTLPLSSTKLSAQTIYYFSYAYDGQQLGNKQATLYISNVFAVSRYSDGTWPLKFNITKDLTNLTPYSETLHGYYTTQQDAESMRQAMVNIFEKTGGTISRFNYKGKATSGGGSSSSVKSSDFWETGKKKDSTINKTVPAKKDDFWNN